MFFQKLRGERTAAGLLALLFCAGVTYAVLAANRAAVDTSAPVGNGRAVVIDPGHGGVDGGAVGVGGVVEKGINLAISLKLRSFFESAGYRVVMTREDDRSIHDADADSIRLKKKTDLHNRLGMIEQNPDALFLSIHQNIYTDSRYSGTQVFYSPGAEASKEAAQAIQSEVKALLQPENERLVKMAGKNLFLLYYAKTPAVMVECGFLSNPAETARLQQNAYQNKTAFAIFAGVLQFEANEKG